MVALCAGKVVWLERKGAVRPEERDAIRPMDNLTDDARHAPTSRVLNEGKMSRSAPEGVAGRESALAAGNPFGQAIRYRPGRNLPGAGGEPVPPGLAATFPLRSLAWLARYHA